MSVKSQDKAWNLARDAGFTTFGVRITPPAIDYSVTEEVLRLIHLARAQKGKEMAEEYDKWFGDNTIGSSWIHEAAKERFDEKP